MSSKALLKIMKERQKAQEKQADSQNRVEEQLKPTVSVPVAAPQSRFGGNPFAVFQQQESEEEEEEQPTKAAVEAKKPTQTQDEDESDGEDAENTDLADPGAAKKKKRKRKNKKKKRDLHEVLAEQEEQETGQPPVEDDADKQEAFEASSTSFADLQMP